MHCVDLGESIQKNIWLQKSVSIQPRTSRAKFAGRSRTSAGAKARRLLERERHVLPELVAPEVGDEVLEVLLDGPHAARHASRELYKKEDSATPTEGRFCFTESVIECKRH